MLRKSLDHEENDHCLIKSSKYYCIAVTKPKALLAKFY